MLQKRLRVNKAVRTVSRDFRPRFRSCSALGTVRMIVAGWLCVRSSGLAGWLSLVVVVGISWAVVGLQYGRVDHGMMGSCSDGAVVRICGSWDAGR
ncbi:unnamed protein product [Microthlaspi erraticum]|uniref:Uncharacterized protein n=1 Tax=Microthlaspi erraticum TaxID=1685480 RepID=A0A6D2JJP4_9BRAS|nr:unnamed protein product [Microthlaspi erraticum]